MSNNKQEGGSAAKGDLEKVSALKAELTKLKKQNSRYAEKASKEDRQSVVTGWFIVGAATIVGLVSGFGLFAILSGFGAFILVEFFGPFRNKSPEREKYDLREARIQEIENLLDQVE